MALTKQDIIKRLRKDREYYAGAAENNREYSDTSGGKCVRFHHFNGGMVILQDILAWIDREDKE